MKPVISMKGNLRKCQNLINTNKHTHIGPYGVFIDYFIACLPVAIAKKQSHSFRLEYY